MLSIKDNVDRYDPESALGEITLKEGLCEEFLMSLSIWSPLDYMEHWKKSANKALEGQSSCFVTSWFYPGRKFDNGEILSAYLWAYYPLGDEGGVLRQEVKFSERELGHPDKITPSQREVYTNDGEKISEWRVDVEDIQTILAS